jgi:hypothetical protein
MVLVMVNGTGADLTNDEKRAHLVDLRRPRKDKLTNFVIYLQRNA